MSAICCNKFFYCMQYYIHIYSAINSKTIASTIKHYAGHQFLFNVNIEEIEITAISLSIIQILKDLLEIKDAYKYKNLKINVKNIKHSMVIFLLNNKRTNQQMKL